MSVTQQSDAAPTVEQPVPPHWPHAARQHARPSEDSKPGMPLALGQTSGVKQQRGTWRKQTRSRIARGVVHPQNQIYHNIRRNHM